MLDQNFIEALKILSLRFRENNFIWAVVGSTNLALQGLDIIPRDIDIITTIDSLPKIKNIFGEFDVAEMEEKQSATSGSYWRVVLNINNIEIEVLGEKEQGVYAHRLLAGHKKDILLDDVNIPCLELKSELQAYQETGRQNKVELIESFLLSQNNQ